MEFEFDPEKSERNKAKHGIDFIEAQALWKSKHVFMPAKEALEKRYLVLGKIEGHPLVGHNHLSRGHDSDY